jgi:YVTN family beta-propeller protein
MILTLPLLLLASTLLPFVTPPAAALTIAVVNRADDTVSFIDSETGDTKTLPTGKGAHEAAACGTRVVVSNYGNAQGLGHSLSVYDVASRTLQSTIETAPLMRPHGMLCDATTLFFTSETSLAIGRVRFDSGKVDLVVGHGQKTGHMVAGRLEPLQLFTGNIVANTISRIKPAQPGGWDVMSVAVGKSPEGIDASPDGSQVWAANRADNSISVVDVASGKVTGTLTTTAFIYRLRFTPDGKYVLATQPESGAVLVFDASTRALVKTLEIGGAPVAVAVHPSQPSRAFIVASQAKQVVEVDLATFQIGRKYPIGGNADGIAIAGSAEPPA